MSSINELKNRLNALEAHFNEFAYNSGRVMQSSLKKSWPTLVERESISGFRTATCVNTKDPLGQGRIQIYLPSNDPKTADEEQLRWAWPISVLGGFDDSGALWAPPAGSIVAIVFENGDLNSPYYIGTVWTRNRGGKEDAPDFGFPSSEYFKIHQGNRGGYLVGPDETQVMPPSNTENSNVKDFDDTKTYDENLKILKDVVPSHLHVIKTPGKNRLKLDDGNYYCNQRYARFEMGSACGSTFLMYDDHMHPASQNAHPSCCSGSTSQSGDTSHCHNDGTSIEGNSCDAGSTATCSNPLFKHSSECRHFRGPGTPQNNKCDLQQSGIFLGNRSGSVFVMDDEVSSPQGTPSWKTSTEPFDFGCENIFLGKTYVKSATGHTFRLGDAEVQPNVRAGQFIHPISKLDEFNGVELKTASGNFIELNDDTSSSGLAGPKRGVRIGSTSTALLEMMDDGNKQKSPDRREGGVPTNEATAAYVRLKSGYGMHLLMRDDSNQKTSDRQFLELMTPQIGNSNGPHLIRMQENGTSETPGFILLRAGGYFIGVSTNEWIQQSGEDDKPASMIFKSTEHEIHLDDDLYVHLSQSEVHLADQYIILGAGKDCKDKDGKPAPCLYPVIVGKEPWVCPITSFVHYGTGWGADSRSKRVFAS